jgi:hypothetical protein
LQPSVAASEWTQPEEVWNTGYIDAYKNNLAALSVERYPASNCGDAKGLGKVVDPQDQLITLMSHKAAQDYVAPYLNSTALAVAAGKPFVVMEFNTGTCSGFPGLSDSFAAAMWVLDASLTMASSNYSAAMLHVGGQDAFYNVRSPILIHLYHGHNLSWSLSHSPPLLVRKPRSTNGQSGPSTTRRSRWPRY